MDRTEIHLNYGNNNSGLNLTNTKKTHIRNTSQPLINPEHSKKPTNNTNTNAPVKKIDNLLNKINNLFLSSYSNVNHANRDRGRIKIFTLSIFYILDSNTVTKRGGKNYNHSTAKYNSLVMNSTKNENSLDRTNFFNNMKDQLSNRQSKHPMDTISQEKDRMPSNRGMNITNITTNTKSRNNKDSLLKNSTMFNSDKLQSSSYQQKFLLTTNYIPSNKLNTIKKNISSVQNNKNMVKLNPGNMNQKLLNLKSHLSIGSGLNENKILKNRGKRGSYDGSYKLV